MSDRDAKSKLQTDLDAGKAELEAFKAKHPVSDRDAISLSLQSKLGSICVHAEEMLSAKGHAFDRHALEGLLFDSEVTAWLKKLGPLLPVKR